jgi:hypothetical protein
VRFAPGSNAAGVVAKDFGLEPWWNGDLPPGTPLVTRP